MLNIIWMLVRLPQIPRLKDAYRSHSPTIMAGVTCWLTDWRPVTAPATMLVSYIELPLPFVFAIFCDYVFFCVTGIEVVDANEFVKERPNFQRWEPPVKDDPRFSPPKTIEDDPDYHEDPIHEFHPECCLLEGTAIYSGIRMVLVTYQVPS